MYRPFRRESNGGSVRRLSGRPRLRPTIHERRASGGRTHRRSTRAERRWHSSKTRPRLPKVGWREDKVRSPSSNVSCRRCYRRPTRRLLRGRRGDRGPARAFVGSCRANGRGRRAERWVTRDGTDIASDHSLRARAIWEAPSVCRALTRGWRERLGIGREARRVACKAGMRC